MINVLILCTGNSCRSQIAHGYLQTMTDGSKVNVYSAGIETHGVNPMAIQTMHEDGIDISSHTSNLVLEYTAVPFDYIITVCDHAKEQCPVFASSAQRFHFNFPDPAKATGTADEIRNQFALVREQIKQYIDEFITEHMNDTRVRTN